MPSDEGLHALIQLIYEAAIEPQKWPIFLRKWAELVSAQSAALAAHDVKGRSASMEANVGFDPECLRAYQDHYAALNPWLGRNEHVFLPGRVVNGDSMIAPRELTKTEFYADWLRPYDYLHSYGGVITRQDAIVSYISAMRSQKAGPFEEKESELLRTLMPHLECAARLHWRVADIRGKLAVTTEALDLMDRGVVITDSDGKILLMNASAEIILNTCDGLKCSSGYLTTAVATESRKLRLMIAAVTATAAARSMQAGACLSVSRPSGKRAFEAFVCPISSRTAGWMKMSGALVVITDPDHASELSESALKDLFGLTTAEARLAAALGRGTALAETAESLGVSIETVRSQLKSIFLKTGTNRQAELMRLLSASSARLLSREKGS